MSLFPFLFIIDTLSPNEPSISKKLSTMQWKAHSTKNLVGLVPVSLSTISASSTFILSTAFCFICFDFFKRSSACSLVIVSIILFFLTLQKSLFVSNYPNYQPRIFSQFLLISSISLLASEFSLFSSACISAIRSWKSTPSSSCSATPTYAPGVRL